MALRLYPFRFRDPVTGRWVKARYVAELEIIRERYAEYEILGPPEVREVTAGTFNPHRRPDPARDRDEDEEPQA